MYGSGHRVSTLRPKRCIRKETKMVFSHPILRASAVAFALATPAFAQDATVNTVVATVGEQNITVGHVLDIKRLLPQQYQTIPDEVLFQGIVDQLVRQTLLSQSFEEQPAWIELSIENERRNLRSQIVMEQLEADATSPDAVQALYDERYTNGPAEQEYSAAHILVETEEKAKELIALLDGGADFGETAKAHSTGPSGPRGGDLGWFGQGQMVPPFEQAVMAMEAGAISAPVETQFGWHVIKLNEIRDVAAPAFEEVQGELAAELGQKAIEARLAELQANATVTRMDDGTVSPTVLSTVELTSAQ